MPHVIGEQRIRQRLNWFRKAQELGSVSDACVFFGISRKTYYKWWRRYAASRWERLSLADRSRRPHRQVGTRMPRRLRRLRRRTGYGARRLAWLLRRKGHPRVPSVYGLHRVLQAFAELQFHPDAIVTTCTPNGGFVVRRDKVVAHEGLLHLPGKLVADVVEPPQNLLDAQRQDHLRTWLPGESAQAAGCNLS